MAPISTARLAAGGRPAVPVASLTTESLVRRIRWVHAMKRDLAPASRAWLAVDAEERLMLAILHDRFGVTTITPAGLEWLTLWRRPRP
jgi:hypothetical protein